MQDLFNFHSLFIRDFGLFVKLGCEESERSKPQEVRVSLEFRFENPPHAASTDNLEDTICYARVTAALKNYCEGKSFKLIEKLATDLALVTKEFVPQNVKLALQIHKVKPPIENLMGGTHYRIAEFL